MREAAAAARLPPNYRLVLDVVRALDDGVHVSAAEVFTRARVRKASLGYSTVYRALGRLCGLGLVLELHVPGFGAALYEPARSSHAHFVCAGCGRVEDVDCAVPALELRDAVARRGGKADDIVVTVSGRCAACVARDAAAGSADPATSTNA